MKKKSGNKIIVLIIMLVILCSCGKKEISLSALRCGFTNEQAEELYNSINNIIDKEKGTSININGTYGGVTPYFFKIGNKEKTIKMMDYYGIINDKIYDPYLEEFDSIRIVLNNSGNTVPVGINSFQKVDSKLFGDTMTIKGEIPFETYLSLENILISEIYQNIKNENIDDTKTIKEVYLELCNNNPEICKEVVYKDIKFKFFYDVYKNMIFLVKKVDS